MRKMATSEKLTGSRSSPKLSASGNILQQKQDLEAIRKEKENLLREVIILRSNFNSSEYRNINVYEAQRIQGQHSKKIEEEIKKNRLNIVELTSGQMYQDALKSAEDQLKIYHDGGYKLINEGNEDAAKLREELNKKIVENKYLQEQCQKHDYAVRNFQDRLSFQENKNDQQAKRIRELSAEVERLNKERDLMKKEEIDLETAKEEISSLKGELKSARASIEKHQSSLDMATSQLHEIQEKHRKEICSKDLEINQHKEKQKEEARSKDLEIDRLKEKQAEEIRSKDLVINQMKQEYCNLEMKIKQTDSSERTEKENMDLRESFQKRLEVAERATNEEKMKISTLEKKVQELDKKMRDKDVQKKEVENDLEKSEKDKKLLENKVHALEITVEEMKSAALDKHSREQSSENMKQDINAMRVELTDIINKFKMLEQEKGRLQSELEKALKKLDESRMQCHRAFEEGNRIERESKAKVKEYEEKLKRKDETILQLRKQIHFVG